MRRLTPSNFPPLPDERQPFPTEPPLSAGLAELASWWLLMECGCGRRVNYPLRLMAAERGWKTPLASVLPRLRCANEGCGRLPASVMLIDDPSAAASGRGGTPPTKKLRLL